MEFFASVLSDMGITEGDTYREVYVDTGEPYITPRRTQVIRPTKTGNVEFLPYRLDRTLYARQTSKDGHRWETCKLTRYANPPEGKGKYKLSPNFGTMPWLPPIILDAYDNKLEVDTLVLTEGFKKSERAGVANIPTIGQGSITWIGDKSAEGVSVYTDVSLFINACKVKRCIILQDGDALNYSDGDLAAMSELTSRPHRFYNAAKSQRDILLKEHPHLQVFYARCASERIDTNPKGLDDLLNAVDNDADVCADLLSFGGRFFDVFNITTSEYELFSYLCLHDFRAFYEKHKETISTTPFCFKGRFYVCDGEHLRYAAPPFVPPSEVSCYLRNGIYKKNGRYHTIEHDKEVVLTDFWMEPLFFIKDTGVRTMRIYSCFGGSDLLQLTPAQYGSLDGFSRCVKKYGGYAVTCTKLTFEKLISMVIRDQKSVHVFDRGGIYPEGIVYANGILFDDNGTNHFVEADENRLVSWGGSQYLIPDNTPSVYREGKMGFYTFALELLRIYSNSPQIKILLLWLLATVHTDKLRAINSGKMPLLFLFGRRGTGKTTIATYLSSLYYDRDTSVHLPDVTPKAVPRLLRQIHNFFIFLDEYRSTSTYSGAIDQALKAIFDGRGSTRAAYTNDDNILANTPTTTALVAGQMLPDSDPAVLHRFIPLLLKNTKYIQSEGKNFELLLKTMGTSLALFEVYKHRNTTLADADVLMELFEQSATTIRTKLPIDLMATIDTRTEGIYASLMTMYYAHNDILPFTETDVLGAIQESMCNRGAINRHTEEIYQLFDALESLVTARVVTYGLHYVIQGQTMFLRLSVVYKDVAMYIRSLPGKREFVARDALEDMLAGFGATKERGFYFPALRNTTTCIKIPFDMIEREFGVPLSNFGTNEG
jgi:hypothetical protein